MDAVSVRSPARPARAAAWGAIGRGAAPVAAFATLLLLLAMTIGTALAVKSVMQSQSEARFAEVVDAASSSVLADVERGFTELASIEGFVRANPTFTDVQFQTFASTIGRRNPASQSLGYAPLVHRDNASAFNRQMQARGLPDYRVQSEGRGEKLFPVAHIFPPIPEIIELGAEVMSDSRLRTVAIEAARSGSLVASAPSASKTNPSGQASFFVFSAVYGAAGLDESELLGYAFGVYRVDEFLAASLSTTTLGDRPIRVIDRTSLARPFQIYPTLTEQVADATPEGWVSGGIGIAGRRWELQFRSPPLFGLSAVERNVWVIVLSAGLGLTLFASISMLTLVRSRRAAKSDLDLMASQVRVLVDSALEAIVVVDRHNRVVWANDAFEETFYPGGPKSLAGKDWTTVRESLGVEIKDREACLLRLAEISASETMTVAGEDVRVTAPVQRILAMTSAPVTDVGNRYLGRLFVFRDVTAERTSEEAKSEFIAMVSHELRTPLTSMVGFIDLLMDGAAGQMNADALRLLEITRRNGNRLAHLVTDILDLSRIDGPSFDLEPGPVMVNDVLSEVTESMAADFAEKSIRIDLDLDDAIPHLSLDRERTVQVFTNLVSNALRYTPEGGRVSVTSELGRASVRICVRDTGIGINSEDQTRIFERFVRLGEKSARPSGSTGLGLAITKALVELQGGSISVESEPGAGSTFTVIFWLAEKPAPPA